VAMAITPMAPTIVMRRLRPEGVRDVMSKLLLNG
jgi:hypothetical protein